jgi:hypothetical protein
MLLYLEDDCFSNTGNPPLQVSLRNSKFENKMRTILNGGNLTPRLLNWITETEHMTKDLKSRNTRGGLHCTTTGQEGLILEG